MPLRRASDVSHPMMQPLGSALDGWKHFSVRAAMAGVIIGILINLSNIYYGLQNGVGYEMSMVSALLGYLGFKIVSRFLVNPLTASENVLIISTATATGCIPVTASLNGIVPAMEFMVNDGTGSKLYFEFSKLFLWCLGLSFFGLAFAAMMRKKFVQKDDLPWPGAKAVSQMLLTLYPEQNTSTSSLRRVDPLDANDERLPDGEAESDAEWQAKVALIVKSGVLSGLLTLCIQIWPVLRSIPIFGRQAADKWLWALNISPGFIGQGIITGFAIPMHMFSGSLVGWAILAPLAKKKGWAPGAIDNWETGGRAWIMWISVAGLLADAVVNLAWIGLRPLWTFISKEQEGIDPDRSLDCRAEVDPPTIQVNMPTAGTRLQASSPLLNDSPSTPSEATFTLSTPGLLGIAFCVSTIVCTVAVHVLFGTIFVWYHIFLAILLSLPMALVGIRALGEADWNPNTTLISQLVFAILVPISNPNAMVVNLIAAAITAAGSNQAGDIALDFKIGQLVNANPDAQILGHLFGSIFGALISCIIYRLYTAIYPIPGPLFGVPAAFISINIAKLVLGQGLPDGAAAFVVGFGIIFILFASVKIIFHDRWWQILIPSGTSFAIGMYNTPGFTLSRLLGGTFYSLCKRKGTTGKEKMLLLATGLIIGESLTSVLELIFSAIKS